MKCPLLIIGYLAVLDQGVNRKSECLKGSCAWWNTGLEDCRLAVIDDSLATIMGTLLHLSLDLEKSGKLPHWQPTRK